MVRSAIDYEKYTESELLEMSKKEAIAGLNEKQQRFCEYYLHSYNLKTALMKAGYSETVSNAYGYTLRRNENVQRYILWLKARVLQNTFLSAADILEQHMRIAFADITDFVDILPNKIKLKPSEQIDGQLVKQVKYSMRDGVSIELYDKLRSLDFLAKYCEDMPKEWKQKIEERRIELQEQEYELKKKLADLSEGAKPDDKFMEAIKEASNKVWKDEI